MALTWISVRGDGRSVGNRLLEVLYRCYRIWEKKTPLDYQLVRRSRRGRGAFPSKEYVTLFLPRDSIINRLFIRSVRKQTEDCIHSSKTAHSVCNTVSAGERVGSVGGGWSLDGGILDFVRPRPSVMAACFADFPVQQHAESKPDREHDVGLRDHDRKGRERRR